MIRESLKKLSGRTLNSSLSPDQSIAHGAAYYAGMLLSNDQYARTVFNSTASTRLAKVQQQSVNARALGILVRDESGNRIPHYLIPANTPLPTAKTHVFGTVVDHQTRVHVRIVESGAGADRPPTVLGDCQITDLPADLPEGTEIEVSISYDHQARVHVSARDPVSGRRAEAEIIRQENVSAQLQEQPDAVAISPELDVLAELSNLSHAPAEIEDQPVLLCNDCGTPLQRNGRCSTCKIPVKQTPKGNRKAAPRKSASSANRVQTLPTTANSPQNIPPAPGRSHAPGRKKPQSDPNEAEFWDLVDGD